MHLCEYGCGQIGKYKNKSGKWRCSEFWQQCPFQRKKNGDISKKSHSSKEFKEKSRLKTLEQFEKETPKQKEDRIKKVKKTCRTPEFREAARIRSIELWEDEGYRKQIMQSMKKSDEQKKGISLRAIERYKHETKENRIKRIKKAKHVAKKYFKNEPSIKRQHRINIHKRSIEKIKKKYPIFAKVEEMRYKPGKEKERMIQVRCKNNICKNSKENNGWFTVTSRQIEDRLSGLNTNISYFYCSDKCKQECELFKMRGDPNSFKAYQRYDAKVRKITHIHLKLYKHKIKNLHLRGWKYGYDLDHMFSIYDGHQQNIDPKIIGHYMNLKIIKSSDNRSKSKKSSISLNELLNKIKEL